MISPVDEEKSYLLYQQGVQALEVQNFEKAADLFRESIKIAPHFKTYHRLGKLYQEQKCDTKAKDALEAAYLLCPKNDRLVCDLASLLVSEQLFERAEEILLEILDRNPSYKEARLLLDTIQNNEKS